MSRLFIAELRRIAARRLVRLTVALVFVGVAIGGSAVFLTTSALSQAEYEQRVADADTSREVQQQQVEACLQSHGVDTAGKGNISEEVGRICLPDSDGRPDDSRVYRKRLSNLLQAVSGGLAIVGWTLGASLIGAEFASRSMTTLLTWEPRRFRVFLAKASATILATGVLAFVALLAFIAAMLPAFALHGGPLRPEDPSIATIAGIVMRGTVLCAVAAGLGFSIATLGRNTAAALGAGFAYIVIFENIIGSFNEDARRWLLLGNVIVFVAGRNDAGEVFGRTVVEAALILGAVTLAFLVVALGTFRTRDIT